MAKRDKIEVRFEGRRGNEPLSPENFDIKELAELLHNVESLLSLSTDKERPLITYSMEKGSVRNIFETSLQSSTAFLAVIGLAASSGNLDGLESNIASSIESFQNIAVSKGYSVNFGRYEERPVLTITPETKFYRSSPVWVDAETYLYGTIEDAGGKDRVNIHMSTESGSVVIAMDKEKLKNEEKNILYRMYGARVSCKQNILTGEIDKDSYRLISLRGFNPKFDKEEFDRLVEKTSSSFDGIDADEYVREIRGYYAV